MIVQNLRKHMSSDDREEHFDDDSGLRIVEGWRRMLIQFFIPLDHASHDAAASDSFRLKVVAFCTDKAVQKAVHLEASVVPQSDSLIA